MNLEPAIAIHDLCFTAKDRTILHNLNGVFYKGKITTLVGPSGAGKTTLLKICNGLLAPSSGDILIDRQPIEEYEPTSLRRKVGIALQSAPILRCSVHENLALPRTLQGKQLTEEEAAAVLENVQLDSSFLHREAEELSGGQKQRLSIARTLINQSDILLLDEITSALDPSSAKEIEELILKINRKYGVTIIWITHNLQQARRVSDFTWILQNGKLLASGNASILENSEIPAVQQFLNGGAQ
ncbi:amino acid ABC transporter ATP-binding protein [Lysinibacillus odysseyi 34hs-1 = NBRC 100172]|uniref:Amino acid ABC transporter ATP-binding protein n=1 Tax=Lysinibacillus odysseyi 34hs-1 = NBRC 100172 TaxID=1220589 RepID=A0A0A3IRL3_9BACI|nr:phosphate ABC transporter ATP-binding protein [Lysinibacillus odysseyi]KGR87404.1 amino acid ABC transporter ATP-binding protein [Lysinibacillus odysseyi 34hs-1 = NBRC 100172]